MIKQSSLPLKVIKIQIIKNENETFEEILKTINREFGDDFKIEDIMKNRLKMITDKKHVNVDIDFEDDLLIMTFKIEYKGEYVIKDVLDVDLKIFDLSRILKNKNILSTFIILNPTAHSAEDAIKLFSLYSKALNMKKIGVSIVRGFLLSMLESSEDEDMLFDKYYILSSPDIEDSDRIFDEIFSDIRKIAVYTAKISSIYGGSERLFITLEPGEVEINRKTEEFLWDLMFSSEKVEIESLESWLNYTMEKESTITTMIASMQKNYIEVESSVAKICAIYKKLNERRFNDYPLNFEVDVKSYDYVKKRFNAYILRGRALRERLVTVREEIRTYLSLQQQRISLEEQKASREQLVRLVNLQEIFHKVEIFIVAVYITEMAKIIFEVLAGEMAELLTAFFIPLALLLAWRVSRLLHRVQ